MKFSPFGLECKLGKKENAIYVVFAESSPGTTEVLIVSMTWRDDSAYD